MTNESGRGPNQDSQQEAYKRQAEAFISAIESKFAEAQEIDPTIGLAVECMPLSAFMGYETPIRLHRSGPNSAEFYGDPRYANRVMTGGGPVDDPRWSNFYWRNDRIWMNQEATPIGRTEQTPGYIEQLCTAKGITQEEFNHYGSPLEFGEGKELIDWVLDARVITSSMTDTLESILAVETEDAVPPRSQPEIKSDWPIRKLARFMLSKLRKRP